MCIFACASYFSTSIDFNTSTSGGRARRLRPGLSRIHRRSSTSIPAINLSAMDDELHNLSNQSSGESEEEAQVPMDVPISRY